MTTLRMRRHLSSSDVIFMVCQETRMWLIKLILFTVNKENNIFWSSIENTERRGIDLNAWKGDEKR